MAPRKRKSNPPRKAAKPPVLNLKATEVKSGNSKPDEGAKPAGKTAPASAAKPARPTKPVVKKVAGDAGAGKNPEQDKVAPSKTEQGKQKKKKSGKTALALVSLAALVAAGLGGAWAFKTYGAQYFANPDAVTSEQLAGAIKRIEKLEAGAGENSQTTALIEGLEKQFSQNNAALAANKDVLSANSEKLAKLEKTATEIRVALAKAVEDGNGPVAAANELQFQAITQKIAGLEEGLTGLKETPVKDSSADVAELKTRLDAFLIRLGAAEKQTTATSKSISIVKEAQDKLTSAPGSNPASELAKAFTILRATIFQGVPFETALDNVAGQLPQETLLDVLRPFAKTGAPTLASLKNALMDVELSGPGKTAEKTENSDGGVLGAITDKLSGLVKVTKAGEVGWPTRKKNALQALEAGQVGTAIEALKDGGDAPEGIKKWLSLANGKIQVDQSVKGLSATIVARLTAGSE